jgi:hypothetical protein
MMLECPVVAHHCSRAVNSIYRRYTYWINKIQHTQNYNYQQEVQRLVWTSAVVYV